jgi:hypothetical protein
MRLSPLIANFERFSVGLVCGIGLVALAGCGPQTSKIAGTVTMDGKPLEAGVISFVPADSAGEPVTVQVTQGKYEATTTPGPKLVQISAPYVKEQRKEYDAPDAPLVDVTGERLPPKYNSKTELKMDVAAGKVAKDWSVESVR